MRAITKDTTDGDKTFIQVYDIESGKGKELEVNLRFLKLEGLSQININNSLYLCGWNDDGNDHTGSSFIRIDALKTPIHVSYLVNSSYCHIYPSLAFYKNEYIIIVGGKQNKKCEIFHKKNHRWKDLPELPEDRFGCSLVSDEITASVYLFGGYNQNSNLICCSVLKLNLKIGLSWETIIVKSNSSLLARTYAAINKIDKSTILLFGGKTNAEESTCDIIIYDIANKIPVLSLLKMDNPANFKTASIPGENENNFCFLDDDAYVHKLAKNESYCISQSFFYLEEDIGCNNDKA
jgi:hypothetical protein